MSRIKTHVKAGDEVEVIAGNHKGKTGKVISVDAVKSRVIVDGVRKIRSEQNQEGGIIEQDGPIHLSNVKKVG